MIKYLYITLLLFSSSCFSDEGELINKTLVENRMILGTSVEIVIPIVESCINNDSCFSRGKYEIKVNEYKDNASIDFTNTKGVGKYTINLNKNNEGLIVESEQLTIRDYLDDENYKLCFQNTNIGNVINKLDYSSSDILSEEGMKCIKCSLNMTVKQCKKKQTHLIRPIKSYLYKTPNITSKTKMYLIKEDIVKILDTKTVDSGQKWHFINFKGTKDLNMWIKAEAVDIPDSEGIPGEKKPVLKEVSKINQETTIPQKIVVATKEKKEIPILKEKISITTSDKVVSAQVEQKKSAGGSIPLSLFA